MSGSSSADQILLNFLNAEIQAYRDAGDGSFPDVGHITSLIYFGSSSTNYSGGDTVPGLAEILTGTTPSNGDPVTLDLNNPRTPDNSSDDTTVDIYGSILFNAVNDNKPADNTVTTEDHSAVVFQSLMTKLGEAGINLDVKNLYLGSTLSSVGITGTSALDASKFYEVFEEGSDAKALEYVYNSTNSVFEANGQPIVLQSADMSASLTTLSGTQYDAYAPSFNSGVNLQLGQHLIDAGFVGETSIDAAQVYGIFGNSDNTEFTLYQYQETSVGSGTYVASDPAVSIKLSSGNFDTLKGGDGQYGTADDVPVIATSNDFPNFSTTHSTTPDSGEVFEIGGSPYLVVQIDPSDVNAGYEAYSVTIDTKGNADPADDTGTIGAKVTDGSVDLSSWDPAAGTKIGMFATGTLKQ
jgi:hypothetical protein